eukprot:4396596-Pleurochrysis_carterae.AAC.1
MRLDKVVSQRLQLLLNARPQEDPPLFQTPTMPSLPTTDFPQAHSTTEVPAQPNLDTTMPIAELPRNPP